MLFHASPVPNIEALTPHISNHGKPLIYFSQKPENVLVYLCNAVEKCCRENGFVHKGSYSKWGSYGFNSEGILVLEEYWLNATRETYKGQNGYIYSVEEEGGSFSDLEGIPFAKTSERAVKISKCEYIPNAYDALLQANEEGKIILTKYEDNSPKKLEWIRKTVLEEYRDKNCGKEYRFFLEKKFSEILNL